MTSNYKTAIHEAGHCVAQARCALQGGWTSIIPDPENNLGGYCEGESSVDSRHEALRVTMVCLAGYAAVVASGMGEAVALEGTGDDFENAAYLALDWNLGTRQRLKSNAVEMMRQPENVRAVALVAEHLLIHRRLDADYTDVLISVSDGETTQGEWDEFLMLRKLRGA
ncbi:hypothetical protein [Pseudomonas sp. R5(2019)]|uniref:hypothetical protein n=1 Tax=Pseudomonas sp. R5(2019) TaxID=2697566 RepID=UPI0014124BAF|nr:hypothetical protein [Pseudomonas sp. R5(2019)]NBA96297.1 hypothetical protein [Pseudomonas sp. R5(2019)]